MSPIYETGSTRIITGILHNTGEVTNSNWVALVERTNGRAKCIDILNQNTPHRSDRKVGVSFLDEGELLSVIAKIINVDIEMIQEGKTSEDPSELDLKSSCKSLL